MLDLFNKKYFKIFYSLAVVLLFSYFIQISFGYQGKYIYLASSVSFLLFLMNRCKLLYRIIVIFLLISAIFYSPIGLLYNFPDVNSVSSLMYTNKSESIEFLSNLPIWVYFYQILLLIIGIFTVKTSIIIKGKISYLFLGFFLIVAFSSAIKNFVKHDYSPKELLLLRQPEIRFFIDGIESYIEVRNSNNEYLNIINTKSSWNPIINNNDYDIHILVIGESVRKDFMNQFGYTINNTPWMNQQPGIFLNNFISAGPSTVISLTHSLVLQKNTGPDLINNIVTLANSANFETWWISNQGSKGAYDSPVAIIGKMSDHFTFIKDGNSNDKDFIPDDLLLPYIKQALNSDTNKKKLIVVHIFGSHPQPCARTDGYYENLVHNSKETSCYVQSIKQTDDLLKNINNLLSEKNAKWSMLYFADHGLRLINKGSRNQTLTHGYNTKQSYQVPFFITSYDANQVINIDAKRSGIYLLPTLAQWMGLDDDLFSEKYDWLSNKDYLDQIEVYDSTAKKIIYDKLENDFIEN